MSTRAKSGEDTLRSVLSETCFPLIRHVDFIRLGVVVFFRRGVGWFMIGAVGPPPLDSNDLGSTS
eukprot:scaffold11553_cov39-Cyclotella_meneghiniana.AAC.6